MIDDNVKVLTATCADVDRQIKSCFQWQTHVPVREHMVFKHSDMPSWLNESTESALDLAFTHD